MVIKSERLSVRRKAAVLGALGVLVASLAMTASASASKPQGSVLIPPELSERFGPVSYAGSPCRGSLWAEAIYKDFAAYAIRHGIQGSCSPWNGVNILVTWCRSHITNPFAADPNRDLANLQDSPVSQVSCDLDETTNWVTAPGTPLSHGSEIEFTIEKPSYAWIPPPSGSWCHLDTPQIAGCGVGRWFDVSVIDDVATFG